MDESIAVDLLAALGILVLERLQDSSFRMIGTAPDWFNDLYPDAERDGLRLEEKVPFLETFFTDAENFWISNSRGRLKSGPWNEIDPAGNELHLEASALCLRERRILLIELLGTVYEEKQSLLQKLRESSLDHNRLVKEIRAELVTAANSAELSGQILNERYKLQRLIGQGGLGAVYQALDLTTQKIVAVKLLLENEDGSAEFSQQLFEREIKILKRVHHPNIVAILDSGMSATGRLYLVMEFIEGQPLDELIRQEGVWSVERTLNLLKQICPALYSIHQQKIIHRDLKPANIMISGSGDSEVAVLLDLGIAKMVRGNSESSLVKTLTKAGVILGTVQYLSPEQCLDGELDEGTDIYSLGVMVYELLAGLTPFEADSIQGWLLAHLQSNPIPLCKVNPYLSKEVEQVVLWALAKKREDRPSTMIEFLENFERAAKSSEERLITKKTTAGI